MASLRLYTSNASPFCLKVRSSYLSFTSRVGRIDTQSQIMVLMKELKLSNVELDYSVKAFPTFQSTAHDHLAPLGKIPALTIQQASETAPKVLFGSQVIAQYLDSISPERKALPPLGGLERFEALTLESLSDGVCEAALNLRYERLERVRPLLPLCRELRTLTEFARRFQPSELLWTDFVDGQLSKITRAIPLLSKRAVEIDPTTDILPLGGVSLIAPRESETN